MPYNKFNGFLFSNPKFFDVNYKINPYMEGEVNNEKSWSEWSKIVYKFRKYNADVHASDYQTYRQGRTPVESLPDAVFAANHAMPIPDEGFVLANMADREREPEPYYFSQWADYNGYDVRSINENFSFEGCGDAKWHPEKDKLWLGYGVRTDEQAVKRIRDMVDSDVEKLELQSEHYYHLDVCFEPLGVNEALYIPEAFSSDSVKKLEDSFDNLIEVCDEDKKTMGGNCALVEKNRVFIDKINNCTAKKLRSEGYKTVHVDTEEFMKAGGSVDCLFLRIP